MLHFLISATHHMSEALDGLPSGPRLPNRLKDQIHLMRHTLEHWSDDDEGKDSWKTLVLKHATGPDLLSLDELEQVLTRVRDELLEVYPVKPKLLEVYHGKPQLIEADAKGRAVARAWQEMLELHDGRWELIDREQFRARVRELLELNREAPMTVPDPGESKSRLHTTDPELYDQGLTWPEIHQNGLAPVSKFRGELSIARPLLRSRRCSPTVTAEAPEFLRTIVHARSPIVGPEAFADTSPWLPASPFRLTNQFAAIGTVPDGHSSVI